MDLADVAIVDYGMGNLRNVQKAFEHIGVPTRISAQAADLGRADGVVLPGVGAFGDAMDNLRAAGLVEPIRQAVAQGKPLLGICLGLQLLFDESEEMGWHRGLGILPGRVVRFGQGLKVPHIGWNQLQIAGNQGLQHKSANQQISKSQDLPGSGSGDLSQTILGSGSGDPSRTILAGIPDHSYAYFVHSYYVEPADPSCVLATTCYGVTFASVVGQGNVFGAQPHPEKSQEVGLRLLKNFATIVARSM